VATYVNGTPYFDNSDWESTFRVRGSASASNLETCTSLPFGEDLTCTIALSSEVSPLHFTGQEHDSGSGDDHFPFRYYNEVMGRWLTPDPAGLAAADPTNPQSWNRYAYVMNNPTSFVDPSGLITAYAGFAGQGGAGPFGCSSDGMLTYCSSVSGLLADGFALPCPDAGCPRVTSTAPNVSLIAGVNGWVWVNNNNGAELSDGAAAELGLFGFSLGDNDAANNGSNSTTPPPCQAKILNAANNHFGTNYTDANVTKSFSYSTGAPPDTGTFNVNISGSTAGMSPNGYYPVNWWTYVVGYGPTLHVVSGPGGNGGLDSQQGTLQFGPDQATLHIDSGFPYNPIGAFFHWLLNMTGAGGYPQC
jgi:RHS repeat-associated protein